MSTEQPTFSTFDLATAQPSDIYKIGATSELSPVLAQISHVVRCPLAPEPTDESLAHLAQAAAGMDRYIESGHIYRWVQRSGLLAPMQRSFISPRRAHDMPNKPMALAIMGGREGALVSRVQLLRNIAAMATSDIRYVLLAGGSRQMTQAEIPEGMPSITPGATEHDYVYELAEELEGRWGFPAVDVAGAESTKKHEIIKAGMWRFHSHLRSEDAAFIVSSHGEGFLEANYFQQRLAGRDPEQTYIVANNLLDPSVGKQIPEPQVTHDMLHTIIGSVQVLLHHLVTRPAASGNTV